MTNGAELPCSEEVPELAAGAWTLVFIISGQVDQDDRITFSPSLPFGGVDGLEYGPEKATHASHGLARAAKIEYSMDLGRSSGSFIHAQQVRNSKDSRATV